MSTPQDDARAKQLAAELRCLVCQNQSIADSNATLAVDLRQQITEQIAAGKSDGEIKQYMAERYGDFVLYNPPLTAGNLALWAGPFVLLLAGLVAAWVVIRKRKPTASAALNESRMKELEARYRNESGPEGG